MQAPTPTQIERPMCHKPKLPETERRSDIEVCKLVNHLVQVSPDLFSCLKSLLTLYSVTRGHNYRIFKQHCKINLRLKFFNNWIISQWNSLPCYVITSDSLNKFKNNLDKYWKKIGYGQTKRPLAY